MTELLLISLCFNYMNTDACQKSELAYYKQTGDEKILYDYGQKMQDHYKQYTNEFIVVGTIVTVMTQHNYSTKLMSIEGVDVITSVGDTSGITLRKNY